MSEITVGSISGPSNAPVQFPDGIDASTVTASAPLELIANLTLLTTPLPTGWSLLNDQAKLAYFTNSTVLPAVRYDHAATLLADGRVLVTGGYTGAAVVDTCYIGTVSGNTISWVTSTVLPAVRYVHAATLLADGRVLVTGGNNGSAGVDTCYIGTVSGNTISWVTSTVLPAVRYDHAATLLADGRVLVTGGNNGSAGVDTCYIGTVSYGVIKLS